MNFRSLTSASVFSLALTLTACPPADDGTASDTQSTGAPMTTTGTTDQTTTATTEQTTGTTATSSTTVTTGGTAPAFADIQAIFSGTCSCHLTAPSPGNGMMELTDGKAYANIVGVASSGLPAMNRIEPGQPDNSYLWLKIAGGYLEAGGKGDPMPLVGMLTQEQLDTIEAWIIAGAPAD